ncbi:hypothetical protein EDC96DRAFT_540148 [Choanephora cucurbitarum]|nr:hypothetical protein EDC96DRAFT_540148 [Choanephora cucurbitarum]
MRCSEETEHGQRTMSRQETYKRTDTTLIRRRFNNVNTTPTSSDNHYISEKACESVIYQRTLVDSKIKYRQKPSFFFLRVSFVLERIDGPTSYYFQTSSGTDMLARFASHPRTRLLLLEIIKKKTRCQHSSKSQQCSRNPLAILIDADDFDLYKLLLNRVLLDSFDIKDIALSSPSVKVEKQSKSWIYTDNTDSSDPSADPNVAFSDGASNDFVEFFKSFESV